MRRFLSGFLFGIVVGAVFAWLYQRYMQPCPETIPAKAPPIGVPPAKAPAPPADFAAIRGIGAHFAERLHQAGIHTFAELARLAPEEVAERCQAQAWRVRRDDWIGQAAALARE
jgi:NADH-quinone oxidoreductase subunit E